MSRQVTVRFYEEEGAAIELAAASAGAGSVSAWIRDLVLSALKSGSLPERQMGDRCRGRTWQLPVRFPNDFKVPSWGFGFQVRMLVLAKLAMTKTGFDEAQFQVKHGSSDLDR